MASFTLRVDDRLFLRYKEYCDKKGFTKSDDLRNYIYNTVSRYENTLNASVKNIRDIAEDFCSYLDDDLIENNKKLLFELSEYLVLPYYELEDKFLKTIDKIAEINNMQDKIIDFDMYYLDNLKNKMDYKDFIAQFLIASQSYLNKK